MPNKSAGRAGHRWQRLRAEVKAKRGRCCRCHQAIDYTLSWPDVESFSVDHYPHPLSTHPHLAEDPANLAPAHLRCNISAGTKQPKPALGDVTGMWG